MSRDGLGVFLLSLALYRPSGALEEAGEPERSCTCSNVCKSLVVKSTAFDVLVPPEGELAVEPMLTAARCDKRSLMFVGLRYEGEILPFSSAQEFLGEVGLPVIGLKSALRSISGFVRGCPGRVVEVVAVDCDKELPGLLGFKNAASGMSSSEDDSLDDSDVSVSEGFGRRFAFDAATLQFQRA